MSIPYLTVDPTTGQPIDVYEDGTVVPAQETPAPTMTTGPAMEGAPYGEGTAGTAGTGAPIWPQGASEGTDGASGSPRASGRGGYARRVYGGTGRYTDGAGSSGDGDSGQSLPAYADGTVWSPQGRGSAFGPGDGGADGRSGFRPGYDTRIGYGRPGAPGGQSGGGAAGGGGGGGDSLARDLYWKFKGQLESKLGGMLGGGDSGYSSTSSYDEPRAPRPERMRGRYAHGLDAAQAAGLSYRPTALLPRVFGNGFSPANPVYGRLAAMPAAQMAMLSGGYSGSAEDLANNLGRLYKGAAAGKLPSTQKMLGQLAHGKGINAMFAGEKAGPRDYESYTNPGYVYGQEPLAMGEAAETMTGLLGAALYGEPATVQMKYGASLPGSWGSFLIDKGSAKALRKPAGKGTTLNRYVARRLFR